VDSPAMAGERSADDESYRADLAYMAERVRTLRHERRWGVGTLATQAGLHWTYVRQIEGGERNISVVTLLKLADAFGVEPGALFPDRKPRPPRKDTRRR
jgi:transcriptional regulator with XRE-family HTH domain